MGALLSSATTTGVLRTSALKSTARSTVPTRTHSLKGPCRRCPERKSIPAVGELKVQTMNLQLNFDNSTNAEYAVLPAGVRVLVACEESQATTIELRKLGFDAWSCDLQDCSGGHPEWHIQGDVLNVLNDGWDMMIAHPPCTYLTNSGVCWLWNKDGSRNEIRWQKLKEGAEFFKALLDAPIPLIAIENPIPHKYAVELIGRKYDQLVQPYHFGHTESKATCFWLKGLPKLIATNDVKEQWKQLPKNVSQRLHYLPPGPERAKLRSKTFNGVAQAMAEQWGRFACL